MFKRIHREDGQSYVETALVLPFLILLVVGVLDLGRAFNAHIVVSNAAREGARYGVARASDTTGIKARTLQETEGTGVAVSGADIQVTYPNSTQAPGNPIRVTVTHNFQLLVSAILGFQSTPVTASVEMEILQ